MAEVTNLLKNFKDDGKHAVALGVLKQHHFTVDEKLDLIMNEIKGIKNRLDNIVKLNNLKE